MVTTPPMSPSSWTGTSDRGRGRPGADRDGSDRGLAWRAMSRHWFPDGFELDVDDAGSGDMFIWSTDLDRRWQQQLHGSQIGVMLGEVTARALLVEGEVVLFGPAVSTLLPSWVSPRLARRLLPALQEAVVLAIGGVERFDEVVVLPGIYDGWKVAG